MTEPFWKARSKHGRDKIFKTPECLWDAACGYFEWTENNPLSRAITYQGAVTGKEDLMRPMTVKGLCIHLNVNSKYFNDFNASLDLNKEIDRDFSEVTTRIREIIDTQKFEGATAGLFNPTIIARDLGLADKQETTNIELTHDKWLDSLE